MAANNEIPTPPRRVGTAALDMNVWLDLSPVPTILVSPSLRILRDLEGIAPGMGSEVGRSRRCGFVLRPSTRARRPSDSIGSPRPRHQGSDRRAKPEAMLRCLHVGARRRLVGARHPDLQ